jgi:hypothetical protein
MSAHIQNFVAATIKVREGEAAQFWSARRLDLDLLSDRRDRGDPADRLSEQGLLLPPLPRSWRSHYGSSLV